MIQIKLPLVEPLSEVKAVIAAMRVGGAGLKTAWRVLISGVGLGQRLANSIRSPIYPREGESLTRFAVCRYLR